MEGLNLRDATRRILASAKVDYLKSQLLSKPMSTGFGLVYPRPEGGLSKEDWQWYKTFNALFSEQGWADPKEWRD